MSRSRTFLRDDRETEVEVDYSTSGGEPASGMFGPPEDYDPGSAFEVEIESIRPIPDDKPGVEDIQLTEAERERFEREVNEDPATWEPEDDSDYYREDF